MSDVYHRATAALENIWYRTTTRIDKRRQSLAASKDGEVVVYSGTTRFFKLSRQSGISKEMNQRSVCARGLVRIFLYACRESRLVECMLQPLKREPTSMLCVRTIPSYVRLFLLVVFLHGSLQRGSVTASAVKIPSRLQSTTVRLPQCIMLVWTAVH